MGKIVLIVNKMYKENISSQTRLNLGYENMALVVASIPSAIFAYFLFFFVCQLEVFCKTKYIHTCYMSHHSSTLIYIFDIRRIKQQLLTNSFINHFHRI